jgi:hypothetical protein
MEFRVDTKKYKGILQRGIPIMDRVLIYGYVCISLVGFSLVGMIIFAWIVLRKLRRVPRRWVYSDSLTYGESDRFSSVPLITSFGWIRFRGVP